MAAEQKENPNGSAAPSPLAACVRLVIGRPLANRESGTEAIGIADGVPALGLDGSELDGLRAGSRAGCSQRRGCGRACRARPDHAGHPCAPRHPVRFLLADHRGLSKKRRRLFGCQGQSRRQCKPPRCGGADDRLCAQRRGRHFRRRRRANFGGAGATSLYAATLSRCLGAADTRQSARHHGCRPAIRAADLPVYRLLFVRDRSRRVRRDRGRRPSASGGAATTAGQSRRGARLVAGVAGVRFGLHGDDRDRGSFQRRQCLPRTAGRAMRV